MKDFTIPHDIPLEIERPRSFNFYEGLAHLRLHAIVSPTGSLRFCYALDANRASCSPLLDSWDEIRTWVAQTSKDLEAYLDWKRGNP
jgi:hypothetical protein